MTIQNHENIVNTNNLLLNSNPFANLQNVVVPSIRISNTNIINEKIIRLNYSENLFVNTFKYSDCLMTDLKNKLDLFRTFNVKIRKYGLITHLYCMSCEHAAFLRNSILIKHIMTVHCKIDPVYVKCCLAFTRFDPDFNLLPDRNMLKCVTQNRSTENNVISLTDSDDADINNKNSANKSDLMVLATVEDNSRLVPEREMINEITEKPEVKIHQNIEMNVSRQDLEISENIETPLTTNPIRNKVTSPSKQNDKNSNTEPTNDNLINLRYSRVVFSKCFKEIDRNVVREIRGKMRKYERLSVEKYGKKYNRFVCNTCKFVTCLTIDKILKHILVDHCRIPIAFLHDILVLTSVDGDHQLISDREMVAKINEARCKNAGKQNLLVLKDGKESESDDTSGELTDSSNEVCTTIPSRKSNKGNRITKYYRKENAIRLDYSERVVKKCFQHIARDEMISLVEKLDQLRKYSIRRNGVKRIRFLCNNCEITSRNVGKMLNHVLICHCGVPDRFIDELEIVASLDKNDLQLISDRKMIRKINALRTKNSPANLHVLPQLDDSEKEQESGNILPSDMEILRTLHFNYSVEMLEKCFDHLPERDLSDLQEKLELVKQCTMKRICENDRKYYQCSNCSFRHYTAAHNNFHPLRKHILQEHCAISSENLLEQCQLLIGNKPSFTAADEKQIIDNMKKIRLKFNNKTELPKKKRRRLPANSNNGEIRQQCKIRCKIDSKKKWNPMESTNQIIDRIIDEILLENQSIDKNEKNNSEVREKQKSEKSSRNDEELEILDKPHLNNNNNEVKQSKEQFTNKSNDLRKIEENCEFIQEFHFYYSETLLRILCSVEMKLEFYEDIILHLESLLDKKHRVYKFENSYIYKCSDCRFLADCPYHFTQHVILDHTAIPDDLKSITGNCVIVPLVDEL